MEEVSTSKRGSLRGGQILGTAGMKDHVTPSPTFYVTVLITIKGLLNLLSATKWSVVGE